MTTAEGEKRGRLLTRGLLVVWLCAGWTTGLWLAPRARDWLCEYRSRTTGPAYGMANDAATAIADKLGVGEELARLLGMSAQGLDEKSACSLSWTEQETTYVFAERPGRARATTAFMTATVKGRAVLGRYEVDLWRGDCAIHEGDPERPCTKVERARLMERRELAVGQHVGAEPVSLLAGQCLWRKFDGSTAVVGRYKVDLPAEREIAIRAFVLPASAFLGYRLTRNGQDAPHARGENTMFESIGAGEYELEVRLLPRSRVPAGAGEYTIQVHWGKGAGEPCPVPSFDERECYGVELPKPEPEREAGP